MFQLTSVAPMLQNKYINDLVEKKKKSLLEHRNRARQSSRCWTPKEEKEGKKRRLRGVETFFVEKKQVKRKACFLSERLCSVLNQSPCSNPWTIRGLFLVPSRVF